MLNPLRASDAYIRVSKLTITGSDNGLLPGCHQALFWTNAGILLIGPLGTNFNVMIFIQENAFEIVVWKLADILSWPQYVKLMMNQSNEGIYVTNLGSL